ncbi:MAG: PDDEXK nuclease domain-containing protein [Archangium sp.]
MNSRKSALEDALVRKLEDLLHELGGAFTFVGRQRRLRVGGAWYRVDVAKYALESLPNKVVAAVLPDERTLAARLRAEQLPLASRAPRRISRSGTRGSLT